MSAPNTQTATVEPGTPTHAAEPGTSTAAFKPGTFTAKLTAVQEPIVCVLPDPVPFPMDPPTTIN